MVKRRTVCSVNTAYSTYKVIVITESNVGKQILCFIKIAKLVGKIRGEDENRPLSFAKFRQDKEPSPCLAPRNIM